MGRTAAAGIWSLGRALARTARHCLRPPSSLSVLLAVAGLTFSLPCRAEDPVRGEATFSSSGGYARLVLKLAEDVESDVITAGSIIVIRFKRPVDIPVDKLSDAVPDYVGSARRDPDGSAIRLSLARRATINTMTAGERIFVDFLPDSWTGPPPSLPLEVIRELAARARAAERLLRNQRAAEMARKKPPVRVRALLQPTFVRFVFEMPDGINVSSVLNDQKLTLQFNSVLTFDLADAKIAAPPNVASINQRADADTSAVDIALIGEVDVHSFREEKNYIVDVAFQQAEKPVVAECTPPPHRKLRLRPGRPRWRGANTTSRPGSRPHSTSRRRPRLLRRRPLPNRPKSKSSPDTVPAGPAIEKAAPTTEKAAPTTEKAAPAAEHATPAAENAPASPEKVTPVAEDAAPASEKISAPKETPAPAAAPQKMKPVASEHPPERRASDKSASIEALRDSEGLHVKFSFATATPAALFRRADTVWLVFDQTAPIDIEPIRAKGGAVIGDVSRVPLEKGQAIRIRLNRPQMPSLESDSRDGAMSWTLTLADRVQASPLPLTVQRNVTDPSLANVSVPLASPGVLHRLLDPDAGDTLLVVTAPPPARGFIKRQDFVELSLLESAHGVVVHPNSDDVKAEVGPDKVIVGKPGGLTLSTADVAPNAPPLRCGRCSTSTNGTRTRTRTFFARLDTLIKAAAAAGVDQRTQTRLELANFYMARGMYQEARGVTNLIYSETKQGSEEAAVVMVHAVSSILIGHPDRALKDLASPAIGNGYDFQLWKGLAFARQEKWADAREKFKNAEFSIATLPLEMQRIVVADAMRASLEVKDYAGAARRRSELEVVGVPEEMKAEIAVLRGRLAEALGHDKDALDAYKFAANSPDRQAAAEGRQLEIVLRQKRERNRPGRTHARTGDAVGDLARRCDRDKDAAEAGADLRRNRALWRISRGDKDRDATAAEFRIVAAGPGRGRRIVRAALSQPQGRRHETDRCAGDVLRISRADADRPARR